MSNTNSFVNDRINAFFGNNNWNVPASIKRNAKIPLDATSLFTSLSDALNYALGTGAELSVTSPDGKSIKTYDPAVAYPGQIVVVIDNDIVTPYVINADHTLSQLSKGSDVGSTLTAYYTKTQVNSISSELSNAVTSDLENYVLTSIAEAATADDKLVKNSTLTNAIDQISNAVTADYYKKTDTSSATDLATKFNQYALTTTLGTISTNLTNAITAETDARSAADTTLSNAITGITNGLTSYVLKSTAEDSTSEDKLVKNSTVVSKINALDVAELTLNADETLSSIEEVDGKIVVGKQKIDFASKLNPLTADISTISSTLTSDYYTKTQANTISTALSNTVTADYYNKTQVNTISNTLSNAVTANYYNKTQVNSISSELSNAVTANINALSNEITTTYATKEEIAGLVGVTHFKGIISYDLSSGENTSNTTNHNGLSTLYTLGDPNDTSNLPQDGDIVLNPTSGKEFICYNDIWYEIGDEKNNVSRSELTNVILTAYYKKTETSSALQLTAEFAKYALTATLDEISSNLTSSIDTKTNNISTALSNTITADYYKKSDVNTITSTLSNAVTSDYYNKTQVNSISSALSNAVTADYYKKSDVNTITSTLSNAVTSDLTAYYTKTQVNEISTALTNSITSEADARATDDEVLSNAITAVDNKVDNKIKIDSTNVSSLNIVNISRDDYHQLVATDATDNKTLYIVSGDNQDVYGERITNLGAPSADTDAATKGYVDTAISGVNAAQLTALNVNGTTLTVNNHVIDLQISAINCGSADLTATA